MASLVTRVVSSFGRGPLMTVLAPPTLSFRDACAERIRYLENRGRSASTIRHTINCRDYYLAYLQAEHGIRPTAALKDALTYRLVDDFGAWLRAPGRGRRGRNTERLDLSARTIKIYLVALKAFALWCVRDADPQLLATNPLERYRTPFAPVPNIQPYRDDELAAFYQQAALHPLHWRRNTAIITLLLQTGLRESELVSLERNQLNYHQRGGGWIDVFGKGSKFRTVIFGKRSEREIGQYLAMEKPSGRWLFPSPSDPHYPLAENSLYDLVRIWAAAAHIPKATVHRFRHTFATQFLARHPGDLFTLQKLLGHTSLEMVRRYAKSADVRRLLEEPAYFDDDDAGAPLPTSRRRRWLPLEDE